LIDQLDVGRCLAVVIAGPPAIPLNFDLIVRLRDGPLFLGVLPGNPLAYPPLDAVLLDSSFFLPHGRHRAAKFQRAMYAIVGDPTDCGRSTRQTLCEQGLVTATRCRVGALSRLLLAEQLSGGRIDQMQPRTAGAIDGFIRIGWISLRPFGQPNLDVQAGLRTADDNMSHPSILMRLRREDIDLPQASSW
jgi:hypothetical protein